MDTEGFHQGIIISSMPLSRSYLSRSGFPGWRLRHAVSSIVTSYREDVARGLSDKHLTEGAVFMCQVMYQWQVMCAVTVREITFQTCLEPTIKKKEINMSELLKYNNKIS